MNKKSAVFSCLGMGDGLISLTLSHNLSLNKREVVTFHPFLAGLQNWFPALTITPFPSFERMEEILSSFDEYFIFFEKSSWMQQIIAFCKGRFPSRTIILNPIATNRTDYLYWENGRFDGNISFVDNLERFCKRALNLENVARSNGITIPNEVTPFKFPSRVVIHPTSSRPGKNWSWEKYLSLSGRLKKLGYHPEFILTPKEKEELHVDLSTPDFSSLDKLAAFVVESGSMIGNDSGIGHLASCLGVPALTICRNQQVAKFWRPGWEKGIVLTPSRLIPNLKGLRLRDKHWKKWISTRRVLQEFLKLVE